MAALSRNTASVAQDFHNAGGGVKTFVSNHSAEDNYKKIIMKHIKTEASTDVPWRQEYEQQQQIQHQQLLQFAPSAATFKNVSPPAPNLSHQHQPITTTMMPTNYSHNNRKRRKVSHEKENENIFFEEKNQQSPTTSPSSSTQTPPVLASQLLNTNLKTHFDNYIRAQFYNPKKHLNLQAIIGDAVDAKDNNNRQSFKLPNHPELELSVTNVKIEQNIATDLRVGICGDGSGITIASAAEQNERVIAAEKRGRKQAQPRKVIEESEDISSIELLPTATIPAVNLTTANNGDSRENQIRDKHLDRLVSKKLRCTICRNRNQCMIMPYHTKASLMLHKMWRHTARNLRCKLCPYRCCKSYKMKLHRRQRHPGDLRR